MRREARRGVAVWAGAWLALVAVAVALSVWCAAEDRLPGDLRITEEMQTWDALGGTLADGVRAFGTTQVVLVAGSALALALFAAGDRREAIALAAALVALSIAQPLIKELVDRPRPPPELVEIRGSATSPSFPSGHVMSGTVLFGFVLWMCAQPRYPAAARAAAAALAAAVLLLEGPVNVYLGVHWPSDVIGGYLWGLVVLLPALAWLRFGAGAR